MNDGSGSEAVPSSATSRRRVLAPVIMVVIIGLAMLAVLVDGKLTLEYVRALAWPGVLVGGLYWLREPVKAKLRDLLKVEVGVASAEFGRTYELQEELAEPVAILQSPSDVAEAPELNGASGTGTGSPQALAKAGHASAGSEHSNEITAPQQQSEQEPQALPSERETPQTPKSEQARRKAIERIIKESAEWGYDMAKIGGGRPIPEIEWTSNGSPRISNLRRDPDRPQERQFSRQAKIRRLETEIKELEISARGTYFFAPTAKWPLPNARRDAEKKYLEDLKLRLWRLDPNSAYVD